jgi:hypothetical protein
MGRSDYLQWIMTANVIACAVVVVTAVLIAYHNLNSRNIALGTGAAIGAIVAFALQLLFDLQPATRSDDVSFSYTFDFTDGDVCQWDYTKTMSRDILSAEGVHARMRPHVEIDAGKWLFSNQRTLIEEKTRNGI